MEQVSKFLNLNLKDLIKGMIVAFIVTALQALFDILKSGGNLPSGDQWKTIVTVSLTATIGYLLKNWLTNSNDQFLKREP